MKLTLGEQSNSMLGNTSKYTLPNSFNIGKIKLQIKVQKKSSSLGHIEKSDLNHMTTTGRF